MTGDRRLLAVHAHPDDESITTGGSLARCATAGVCTAVVTCTDGRYGPVNPELGLDLDPDGLASVRAAELGNAATILGVSEAIPLGFHDSGMTGSPHNRAPQAFCSLPCDEVVDRLVTVLRRFRPHVVVTYDAYGCTGHPDHIQAHRMTLLAVEAAAEHAAFPDSGPSWVVSRVFYPVYPLSAMESFIAGELAAGRAHPFDGRAAGEINYVRPDEMVTHRVDIAEVHRRKCDALHAHRSQVGPHYPQLYRAALARRRYEHFRIAIDRHPMVEFDDVFQPAPWSGA